MKFRVDVFAATGSAPIGKGPIGDVLGVSISERLNQVGEMTLTIPAPVAAERGLARGMRYRVYHATLGYLGEFKHIDSTVDATAETITIRAYDSLINLAERVAGFRRNFSNQQFGTVATSLFNTSMSWTVSYEGETAFIDPITYSVEGENYLRMADYLRKYIRGWFRRQGDTEIRFGRFSSSTPLLTFLNPNPVVNEIPVDQAIITQITRTRAGGEIVNRVYPVGAGIGETKLDLGYSDRSVSYSIQSTTIGGTGALAYFLADSTSIATYGAVERVIAWNEIRPVTNSAADLKNAANALYDIASAYLQRYRNESDAYTLTAVNVPSTLRVGDLVRVLYNGVAELENGNVGWLNVASNFFVTDITRSFDEAGEAQTTLSVSANGDAVIGDTEVLYDILADVQTLKLRTQPTQTYISKSYDTVVFQNGVSYQPKFNVKLGPEVLEVNELYLELVIRPLAFPSVTVSGSVDSKDAFTTSAMLTDFTGDTSIVNGMGDHYHKVNHSHALLSLGGHTHAISSVVGTMGVSTGAIQSYNTKPMIAIGNNDLIGTPPTLALTTGSTGNTRLFPLNEFNAGTPAIVTDNNGITYIQGWGGARINLLNNPDYVSQFDWRSSSWTQFEIFNIQGSCTVHLQIYGRVTIQPIAV